MLIIFGNISRVFHFINYRKNMWLVKETKGFEDLFLNLHGFYLVILPVGIRRVLTKYHIKF